MPRIVLLVCVVLALAAFWAPGSGKVWDRCDLARTLLNVYKFPRDQIDTWMCIAYRETRYNSSHINTINTDGSKDYGLFQINNRWWCHNSESPEPNQNMCNVPCNKVLKHLTPTIECIKIMYEKSKNTWEPWTTYPYCLKEDMTQFTKDCNL